VFEELQPDYRIELPTPADAVQARVIARDVLLMITRGRADGQAMFFDEELNTALDPLRLQHAVGVRCARGSCGRGLGFIALTTQGAQIKSGNRLAPRSQRFGSTYDLADITRPEGHRTYPGWVEDARAGVGYVFPTGERDGVGSGFDERRQYRCSCGATYTVTNTQLLKIYVGAIALGCNKMPLQ
jgi:hypothetical protein